MSDETEARILEAAREVFVANGYYGARMQQIADRAGINKSMLHYYYRSKDRLFQRVFEEALSRIFPRLFEIWESSSTITEKIEQFVPAYIDILREHPYVPGFVVFELQHNPLGLRDVFRRQVAGRLSVLRSQIETAVRNGEIRITSTEEFLVNVVGLCVFPFVARPLLEEVTRMSADEYARFLEERKQTVSDFVKRALKP